MAAKVPPATVQSTHVTYELQSLGWKAFQQLCSTIVGEIWGQTIQSFYDANDGGRDGAFYGTWTTKAGITLSGSFTVQCKFTANPNVTIKASALADEVDKAERLAKAGLADNYLIFTNSKLVARDEEKIRTRFESIEGVKHCAVYGLEQISQWIRESPRLRMLVPRVYGLGDLSQILDERAYAQGVEILSSLGDDLSKFVITEAYRKSAAALVDHGFVLLLGEPACGKSTIAAALALGAADEWGCTTIKVRSAEDFVKHYNPNDHKQFFWIDDAFGATQLDLQELNGWNKTFPHVQAAIRHGAKVIFTSRDYIYQAAKNYLKQSALPVIRESQVVIRVEVMTEGEKEQILYNHIKLGSQDAAFKTRIKPMLPSVVVHKRFSPEMARRLGHKEFTRNLNMSWSSISDFIDRPMDFLKEVITTLDPNSRSALALVFMRNGSLDSPIKLGVEEEHAIELMGGAKNNVRVALAALEGSLLSQVLQDGSYAWRFKHPTIRDAMASLVAADRELMDIYLTGTPVPQMMKEITCGETEIKGAKVIVLESRFDLVIDRVSAYVTGKSDERRMLNTFLAFRCNKNFIKKFLSKNPTYLQGLRVSSYLSAVSDVDAIVRLHEYSLLPESYRTRYIEMIYDLAIEVPDADFLRRDIRTLFSEGELAKIIEHVKIQLLPDLELMVDNWKDNHDGSEDPETHFESLRDALSQFRKEMKNDGEAIELIDAGFDFIEYAIDDLRTNYYHYGEPDDDRREVSMGNWSGGSRSIFDDVDM